MTALLADHTLPVSLDDAQARVTRALQEQGFGVLTFVDVQRTLQAKLGVHFPGYRILGACQPGLAHQALQADPRVGLWLPCNIVLEETATGVRVRIPDPTVHLGDVLEHPQVRAVAEEARVRLYRVAEAITLAGEVAS